MDEERKKALQEALSTKRVTGNGYGRFTKDEIDWIKGTFKDNEKAIKMLRKLFLLDYDFNSPIGDACDMWTIMGLEQLQPHDREINILAHNKMINHIEKMIQGLWAMTMVSDETQEEKEERMKKDSSK